MNDFDVIVIGSGVAGAMVAWKLSDLQPGARILILEAGQNGTDHAQRDEFKTAMIASTSRGDMHAPYSKLPARAFVPVPDGVAESQGAQKYYDQQGPENFKAQYLRQVGGSTWTWRGNTPRWMPSDFRLKSTYGRGLDWPDALTYDTLEPFYAEAERELGVSGDAAEWADPGVSVFGKTLQQHFGTRSAAYPMPAIVFGVGDRAMHDELNKQLVQVDGQLVPVRVFHTPQARTSRKYRPHNEFDERPACEGNSNCIPMCPIQAKYDATVHLRQAVRNGVELRTAALVTSLERDPDCQSAVTRVHYRHWDSDRPGDDVVVTGRFIVLAANAIESPKLLLMSGLANSSDQVGRNLMDHLQDDISFLFPRSLYPFRGPQSMASIEIFRDGPFRVSHSAIRMTVGNDGAGRAPGRGVADVLDGLLAANTFGPALRQGLEDELTRLVRIGFSTEMLPDPANRVTLSNKLDISGLPRPQLHFAVDDYTYEGLHVGHDIALALARGIPGVDQTSIEPLGWPNRTAGQPTRFNTAAHIMGTCRMGDDPATSVVDDTGRSHDHPNLYLAGSSVFTTSGTANPTLTLTALALRTAGVLATQL
ncbi:GMC family oxidoreductase [Nocardia nepalensis]|uniref:GMC family oxidoreductase n=1 Tax=Nocardia nepalensis TaxID=3375448 RepID=UPI003B66DF52